MTEPSPHLDLDALADALAARESGPGESGPDPAAARHLAGCPSCTSRLGELAAAETRVVAVLSALPDPPLPAGLAERLTAALAAEPPLDGAASSGGATVTPLAPTRLRRRWLPAAAAAVLAISGAGLGYTLLTDGRGAETAVTAAGDSEQLEELASAAEPTISNSGIDWADTAAVDAALPAVLGGGVARADAGAPGPVADAAPAPAPAPAAEAPLSASEDSASTSSSGSSGSGDQFSLNSADPLEQLRTPEGLASCVGALLSEQEQAQGVQPIALDYASFKGQPALAVVLPDADPTKVSVFIVGADCREGNEDVLGYVRRPRP